MPEFKQEVDLIPRLTAWDADKAFYDEVPLFKKMMDLYALSMNGDSTYAYELKLRNWKQGLSQAVYYLLAADYVYLVVPKSIAHRVISGAKDELESLGIGLLAVDGSVQELVEPRKSVRVMNRCRAATLRHLENRESLEAGKYVV